MTAQEARETSNHSNRWNNNDLFIEIFKQSELGKRQLVKEICIPYELQLCLKELGYDVNVYPIEKGIDTYFKTIISW